MSRKPPKGERIAKVISRAGVASRREAERLVADGRVRVNGKTLEHPAFNVAGGDHIEVDEKPLNKPEPLRLWIYNKPIGLVSTRKDEHGRVTVFDKLPRDFPRVMSIGRLDINSEGLLLLTNDGEIKRKLELPSTGWLRRYRVRIKGNPVDGDFDPLRRGIEVAGVKFRPMQIALDRQLSANAWLTLGIREGRNREIRRAMEFLGLTVNRLIRISYGPFQLGELKQGETKEIPSRVIRDQIGSYQNENSGEKHVLNKSVRWRNK